jgi:uncharacterized protein (UPF0276 family)
LPVPRVDGAVPPIAAHIDSVQNALGRSILIENVLAELVARTGCGVLLDLTSSPSKR